MKFSRVIVLAGAAFLLTWAGCGTKSQTEVADQQNIPVTPQPSLEETSDPDSSATVSSKENIDQASDAESVPDAEPNADTTPSSEETSSKQADMAVDQRGTDSNIDPTNIDPAISPDPPVPAVAEPEPDPPHFRVLLPTTAGLMLLDVEVRIGEALLDQAFDEQIDQVLQEIGDEPERNWKDLLDLIGSDPARFGRSMFQNQQSNNVMRLFDTNRNGRPDPNEAAKILFRRSQTDQPFRVDGTDAFRMINRIQSPLLAALDRDEDHEVTAEEIAVSRESIMRMDRNGDGRVERSEVIPDPPPNDPAWNRRRASRWGDVAMDLTGYVNWEMLSQTLDQSGPSGAFLTEPRLLERLDVDGDDSISATEAARLRDVEADVRLLIRFAETGSRPPEIEVLTLSIPLRSSVTVDQGNGQVWLGNESFELIVRATDLLGREDFIPTEAFDALDANDNGGLDENEIPAGALREYSFEQLDLDSNGQLTLMEIRDATARQPSIWSRQIRARAAESRDAMFDWLDRNHDQMLSARELRDLPQQLSHRVANQGVLRAEAIPDAYRLHFGRGDPDRNEQLFSNAAEITQRLETRPRWAQAMDSNSDGDIEESEFIGNVEQFRSLDQNDDGFIDTIESGGSMAHSDPQQSKP